MSAAADVAFALSKLVEEHGSEAVLIALRDACHIASSYTADTGAEQHGVSEHWHKAGEALSLAIGDVARAEKGIVDLGQALSVVADTTLEEGES